MKQYHLPTHIITGVGCIAQLPGSVKQFGTSVLLVTGRTSLRRSGALPRVLEGLERTGIRVVVYDAVAGEPTLDMVRGAVDLARQEQVQAILGIGGGSALDTAKATAGLVTQPDSLEEYHRGQPLSAPPLPFIAVPTTAGTGAEVTNNAVLADLERGIKQSIRGPDLFARVAFIDPELTLSLSPSMTAISGADALCQAIESFVGIGAQPVTDALTREAIRLIGRSLVKAYEDGKDIQARSDMLYGSLMAGMALTNARLGGAHGLASPLGYRYEIPHGLVCGVLLPHVMEYSLESAISKYSEVGQLLRGTGDAPASLDAAREAVRAVRDILTAIGIPSGLGDLGVKQTDFDILVTESLSSSHNKNNPKPLGADDLMTILYNSL